MFLLVRSTRFVFYIHRARKSWRKNSNFTTLRNEVMTEKALL